MTVQCGKKVLIGGSHWPLIVKFRSHGANCNSDFSYFNAIQTPFFSFNV